VIHATSRHVASLAPLVSNGAGTYCEGCVIKARTPTARVTMRPASGVPSRRLKRRARPAAVAPRREGGMPSKSLATAKLVAVVARVRKKVTA
jgi:hypothetical protein